MRNKINTIVKGDAFEDKVYEIFKQLLENDQLPVSSRRSSIFRRKNKAN